MRDLLKALLGTDCFSASHAPPESKNGKLRTMLQKIAESSEFEYLECVDYRDMAPKQLEDLYCSVFLAIDDTDEPLFKAARRKIDHYAFGTCAHPSLNRRSSPRLSALAQGSQGSKRRFSDADGAESACSSSMPSQGSKSTTQAHPLALLQNPPQPSKKQDGTRRVLHPQNLLRWPDPSKIVELPGKVLAAIEKLKHANAPFKFKNDNWVSLMDHTFMWMLHVQGTVSFGIPLRERVHALILASVQSLGNPALMGVINKEWTVTKFTDQLNYRTHPPAASRGEQRATMHRYGMVPKTPYTMPLIDQNILLWDGVSEKTLEESALIEGQPGYEQLPFITSAASTSTAQQPDADPMDWSRAPISAVAAPATAVGPVPPPGPLPTAPPGPYPMVTAIAHVPQGGVMWPMGAVGGGSGGFVPIPMHQQAQLQQAGLNGSSAGTVNLPGWSSLPAPTMGPPGRPEPIPGGAPPVGAQAPQAAAKVPKRATSKGAATGTSVEGSAAPPTCTPRPKPFSAAVKQTLHTLLLTKTDPLLKVMEEEIGVEELCGLGAPYLVASIFRQGSNQFCYYVGKPVAQHKGKLICWYPPSASSKSKIGTFESAGIFDQVEDLALAPTFIIKIHREDSSMPVPCHTEEAQAAAKDYTAEGKATEGRKGALAKDNLAWLKAMFTKPGVELSQKHLLGKLPKVIVNDQEVRDALAQCITSA